MGWWAGRRFAFVLLCSSYSFYLPVSLVVPVCVLASHGQHGGGAGKHRLGVRRRACEEKEENREKNEDTSTGRWRLEVKIGRSRGRTSSNTCRHIYTYL